MTKLITIVCLFVCSLSVQAQSNETDAKLLKKYSGNELTKLKTNATEYEFAKHCIKNAFYIGEGSKEKVASGKNEYGKIKINTTSIDDKDVLIEGYTIDNIKFAKNTISLFVHKKDKDESLLEEVIEEKPKRRARTTRTKKA